MWREKKWWEIDETNTEYEPDIDIPLVKCGSDAHVMVENSQDVYSLPIFQRSSPTRSVWQFNKSIL